MPDIKIVVTRDSVGTAWPAEQNSATEQFALGTVNKAQLGDHNCSLSFILSEDGLSKDITLEFPTEEDRSAWMASEQARDGYDDMVADLAARNDDPDNPVTYWTGNAEDYPG